MFAALQIKNHLIGITALLMAVFWFNSINSGATDHGYQIREVDVAGAKELIDAGAMIIDVRGPNQFSHRHIPGAFLITLAELNAGIPARLAAAMDKPIVVYCSDGVTIGPKGTDLLNKAGYSNAVNLKGGIQAWANAGMKVAKD